MSCIDEQALRSTVQNNCHISDARHAGDYTMCVYLMKMREYFRWENGYDFDEPLSREDIGIWLRKREELWSTMESRPFEPLPVNGHLLDPFATEDINRELIPRGLVYSAGIGQRSKPLFFLGKLFHARDEGDYKILICAEEYARDLTAPPAMAQGQTIFIRRESLQRMIWEKIEEWKWNRPANAMGRAIADYDLERNTDGVLDAMTDEQLDVVLAHEIGEIMAGRQLGPMWETMLVSMPRSRVEIMARAVRDHLADALSTLPMLLNEGRKAALHFYVATLHGMRREICPALLAAYQSWVDSGALDALADYIPVARRHWLQTAHDMLSLYEIHGETASAEIEKLIDSRILQEISD